VVVEAVVFVTVSVELVEVVVAQLVAPVISTQTCSFSSEIYNAELDR
jgi:hypothetical protein